MKGMKQQEQRQKIIKEFKECERYLKLKGSDEEITSEFLREIETIARRSNVAISDIKPRSVNKFNMYKEYLIEVKLDASLTDITGFLYALNNSILLLKTDKLILTLKDESDNILRANMLISGVIVL
jgi:AAA+ ATPase superfamily predicted ATPase